MFVILCTFIYILIFFSTYIPVELAAIYVTQETGVGQEIAKKIVSHARKNDEEKVSRVEINNSCKQLNEA